MQDAANKIMECMGVKTGETVLIIADTLTPKPITESLFKSAKKLNCEVMVFTMLPRKRHGQELPVALAQAMKYSDVVIAPTTYSLTHTQAKINACKSGTRLASMPGITEEMMVSGGLTADYNKIHEKALKCLKTLKKAKKIRIVTDLGTDILFELESCIWFMDIGICHEPGCSCNLPAGEMYIAPKNANGVFVVDGSMGGIGILESPLTFRVIDRFVTDIKGKQANQLIEILDSAGRFSRNIAELGIGINPKAKLIGNVLEDEKVDGTVHIALGDSSGIGGDVIAGVHLDGIITKPKIEIITD